MIYDESYPRGKESTALGGGVSLDGWCPVVLRRAHSSLHGTRVCVRRSIFWVCVLLLVCFGGGSVAISKEQQRLVSSEWDQILGHILQCQWRGNGRGMEECTRLTFTEHRERADRLVAELRSCGDPDEALRKFDEAMRHISACEAALAESLGRVEEIRPSDS